MNTTAAGKVFTPVPDATFLNVSARRSAAARLLAARLLPWIPAVALAIVIYFFAVNVPYGNDWDLIPFIDRLQTGKLSWAQLINGPGMVFTNVVIMPILRATDFNVIAQTYVGLAFQALAFVFLWAVLESGLRARHQRLIAPLAIITALVIFFPAQNHIWSYSARSLSWGMANFVVALTVWLLARWPSSVFTIAACAVLSSVGMLGLSSGVELWGVVVTAVLMRYMIERSVTLHQCVALVAATLALAVAYFAGFVTQPLHISVLLAHPLRSCAFIFVYLGWPLIQSDNLWLDGVAGLAGLVLLLLGVSAARRDPLDRRAILTWLSLPGYGIFAAVFIAAKPLEEGFASAIDNEYSVGWFFWIGFAVTAVVAVWGQASNQFFISGWSRRLLILAVIGLCINFAWRYQQGYLHFAQAHMTRTVGLTALYQSGVANRETALEVLDADTSLISDYSDILARRALGPFSPRMSEERRRLLNAVTPVTNIVEGEGFFESAGCGRTVGWAWDRQQPDRPIKIDIYDREVLLATVQADTFRRDLLNDHIGNGLHGFEYAFPINALTGAHTIHARISGTHDDLNLSPKSIVCE